MLFSSPAFFVFFLAYVCLHLLTRAGYRGFLSIVGSTVFYAWWRVEYAWLPYALMAVAYGGVEWLSRASGDGMRRRRAALAIVVLFVPLVVFKYADFFYRDVAGPVFGWRGTLLNLPLPLGVSFVTFTLTAYIVDVQKWKYRASEPPSTVLAYVLFFPHLIAGPILRPHELMPQLDRPRRTPLRRLATPIAIFTVGLVKKLVFADPIAEVVDAIYRQAGAAPSGPAALLAIYGFAVQIYCDFSGYTDMAIGLALMLGVRLPNNFHRPYGADSIVEFWRRWHITLSYWFRDYVYIPLGGSRGGRVREARNVIVTMALAGLWHGANWTFVVWGLFHGIGVAAVHAMRRVLDLSAAVPRWLTVVVTFHFVTVGWVFFRAPTLRRAGEMLSAVAGGGWSDAAPLLARNLFVVTLMAAFFLVHRFDDHRRIRIAARSLRPEILWPVLALLWIVAITVSQGSSAKFIYFDF